MFCTDIGRSLHRRQTNLDWHLGFNWFVKATTVHSDTFVWPADAWDRGRGSVSCGIGTASGRERKQWRWRTPSPRLLMLVGLATWSLLRIITKGTATAGSGDAVWDLLTKIPHQVIPKILFWMPHLWKKIIQEFLVDLLEGNFPFLH